MAKILRKLQKIFGSTAGANEIGEIGSFAAGSPAYSTDPDDIQSLSNYLQGWYGVVVGQNSPAIQDMNALDYLITRQLAYLFQAGVAEYDSGTTYYIGSLVNSGGILYSSITDDNVGNAVTNATYWRVFAEEPTTLQNCTVGWSLAGNALTLSLKNKAGQDPSAASPVVGAFRSTTDSSGLYDLVTQTAAASLTISSGSTLGSLSGELWALYVYLINNAGTLELAVSSTLIDTAERVINTTAEGGAGAADSINTIYSATARSGVAARLIGKFISIQATAGTWVTSPNFVSTAAIIDVPSTAVQGRTAASLPRRTYLGETISANFGAATTAVANTFVDASGQLALEPGNWVVYLNVSCSAAYTSGAPVLQLAIRDTSNNIVWRTNWTPPLSAAATVAVQQITACVQINISAPTTYKLSIRCNADAGVSAGSINADEATPTGGFDTDSFWFAKRPS